MSTKHTPGPWGIGSSDLNVSRLSIHCTGHANSNHSTIARLVERSQVGMSAEEEYSNLLLLAAAPDQHSEMLRYLPVLERAEADPEIWEKLTAGLGIATLNGYRAAIAKATGEES